MRAMDLLADDSPEHLSCFRILFSLLLFFSQDFLSLSPSRTTKTWIQMIILIWVSYRNCPLRLFCCIFFISCMITDISDEGIFHNCLPSQLNLAAKSSFHLFPQCPGLNTVIFVCEIINIHPFFHVCLFLYFIVYFRGLCVRKVISLFKKYVKLNVLLILFGIFLLNS